jgi:hypothetical protein
MGLIDAVKKVVDAPRKVYEKVEEVQDRAQTAAAARSLQSQKKRYVKANIVEATETSQADADLASGKISQRLHDKRVERVEHKADEMRKPPMQRLKENASYIAKGVEATTNKMQVDRGGKVDASGNVRGGEGIFAFPTRKSRQPVQPAKQKAQSHKAAPRQQQRPLRNSRFGTGLAFDTGTIGFNTPIDFSISPVRQPERQSSSGVRGNPYDLGMDFGGLFRKPKR